MLMPVFLKNTHTSIRHKIEIAKVTNVDNMLERGYIYFGTYTFLIIAEFRLKEVIACFVDVLKKSYSNLPVKRKTG